MTQSQGKTKKASRSLFRSFLSFLFTLSTLLLAAASAKADGILIPDYGNIPTPPRGPAFSIKYHKVNVDIEDQAAKTSVDQVFKNETNLRMEATYIFPLPEQAAITNFSMMMNGEMVTGKLLDKAEARSIYEEIVRKMKDPGLLEYMGRGIFSARVFPIEPNGDKQIQIAYQEINSAMDDTYHYLYPLNTERFSAKLISNVTVFAKIKTTAPLKNIYSPSHKISIRRINDYEAEVSFEETNTRPDKDFELYYSVSRDDIGISFLTHKPAGEDPYFLLLASPRVVIDEKDVQPKDVVFVLDRTGSMQGEKMTQAKAALKFCVKALNKNDNFNVITFNEGPDTLFDKLSPASEDNVKKAVELADKIEALGGTNIDAALQKALPMAGDPARPAYILFLTDGMPTVGITDVTAILKNAAERAPKNVRLFVFGVGDDVNTQLLDKLSEDHNGQKTYIRPGEDLEAKVSNLYRMISNPVLTDLKLDLGALGAYDIVPRKFTDIFKGTQLIITGRFAKAVPGTVTLSGSAAGKNQEFTLKYDPAKEASHPFIPAMWASRRIGALLEDITLNGPSKELIDEVVRLSKKYGIITQYTSFLVTEPGAGRAQDLTAQTESVKQRVANEKKDVSGSLAVNRSVQKDEMKAAPAPQQGIGAPSKTSSGTINTNLDADLLDGYHYADIQSNYEERYVNVTGDTMTGEVPMGATKIAKMTIINGRPFYIEDKVWIDGMHKDGVKTLKIKPFSDAQMELLRLFPRLGDYMTTGLPVIVSISDTLSIQLADDGKEKLTDEDKKLLKDLKTNL